jgi:hypothetical protein
MRERGFDGLLVAGFRAREMYETYISDDYNEGCVIFPLEGDPVVITWAYLRVMRAGRPSAVQSFGSTITAWRPAAWALPKFSARSTSPRAVSASSV